jgi:hypothetical protein
MSFQILKDATFSNFKVTKDLKVPIVEGVPDVDPGFQGNIIFDTLSNRFFGYVNDAWIAITASNPDGPISNAVNLGVGEEVFVQQVGDTLEFRTLTASDPSLSLTSSATELNLSVATPSRYVYVRLTGTASAVGTVVDVPIMGDQTAISLTYGAENVGPGSAAGLSILPAAAGSYTVLLVWTAKPQSLAADLYVYQGRFSSDGTIAGSTLDNENGPCTFTGVVGPDRFGYLEIFANPSGGGPSVTPVTLDLMFYIVRTA